VVPSVVLPSAKSITYFADEIIHTQTLKARLLSLFPPNATTRSVWTS
jgi:hypothetical protein